MAKTSKMLTSKQILALNAILAGSTDVEAAKIAGVHRMTVSAWKNESPLFISELNRRQNEMSRRAIEPYHKRLDELIDISITTVSKAIKKGDAVSARWLLERISPFPSVVTEMFSQSVELPEPLPTDIDEIIDDIADKQIQQLIKEEGLTELDIVSRPDFFNKIKQDLFNELKSNYQTEIGIGE